MFLIYTNYQMSCFIARILLHFEVHDLTYILTCQHAKRIDKIFREVAVNSYDCYLINSKVCDSI